MGPRRYAGSRPCSRWRWLHWVGLRGMGEWDVAVSREWCSLTRWTRSGYCIARHCFRWSAPDASSQKDQILEEVSKIMQRRKTLSEGIVMTPHGDALELLERWPTLAGWFTDPRFDDGSERDGGWVGVSCWGGLWQAMMKDSNEALMITVTAPTPLQLLDLMEHALIAPEAPWRHDAKAKTKPSRKK